MSHILPDPDGMRGFTGGNAPQRPFVAQLPRLGAPQRSGSTGRRTRDVELVDDVTRTDESAARDV